MKCQISFDRVDQINTIKTKEKIAWAINTFSPYKSPGLDGILPIMLQKLQEIAVPWLETIFKGCLSLNYGRIHKCKISVTVQSLLIISEDKYCPLEDIFTFL